MSTGESVSNGDDGRHQAHRVNDVFEDRDLDFSESGALRRGSDSAASENGRPQPDGLDIVV